MDTRERLNAALQKLKDPEERDALKAELNLLMGDIKTETVKAQTSAQRWLDIMTAKPLPFVLVAVLGFGIGWFAKAGA